MFVVVKPLHASLQPALLATPPVTLKMHVRLA